MSKWQLDSMSTHSLQPLSNSRVTLRRPHHCTLRLRKAGEERAVGDEDVRNSRSARHTVPHMLSSKAENTFFALLSKTRVSEEERGVSGGLTGTSGNQQPAANKRQGKRGSQTASHVHHSLVQVCRLAGAHRLNAQRFSLQECVLTSGARTISALSAT